MKRLYFLVPDVDNATRIVNALKEMGVVSEGVHVIVKNHDSKLDMTQVLEASIFEKTDLLKALVRGSIAGGVVGFILGLFLFLFPPETLMIGMGVIVGLTLFGIIFGAWSSSLIGISIPNPVVQKFERAVEAGGIMMLVDIPKEKENLILTFMKTYHPETIIHGLQLASNKKVG